VAYESFFVYSTHCYDSVSLDEFDTAEQAAECVCQVRQCCPDAHVRVVKGREVVVKDIQYITKVKFFDKDKTDREIT
jgi:hypothetical protein